MCTIGGGFKTVQLETKRQKKGRYRYGRCIINEPVYRAIFYFFNTTAADGKTHSAK